MTRWQFPVESKVVAFFTILLLILPQLAVYLYLPSMPAMARDLKTTQMVIQHSLAIYLLTYALIPLIIGPLSDHYGRKPILLSGLLLYIIGCAGSLIVNSASSFLIFRAIAGMGGGASSLHSRAILGDALKGQRFKRWASYRIFGWVAVPFLAPVLGGYVQGTMGWRANFALLSLIGLALLVLYCIFIPETKHRTTNHHLRFGTAMRNYLSVLSNRYVMGHFIAIATIYGTFVAFAVLSPFLFLTTDGLNPFQYGLLMGAFGLAIAFGVAKSLLVHRLPVERQMMIGLVLAWIGGAGFLILAFTGFIHWLVLLSVFLICVAVGKIWPLSFGHAFAFLKEHFGSASALAGGISTGGSALISFIVSFGHLTLLAWIEVALILLTTFVLFWGRCFKRVQ